MTAFQKGALLKNMALFHECWEKLPPELQLHVLSLVPQYTREYNAARLTSLEWSKLLPKLPKLSPLWKKTWHYENHMIATNMGMMTNRFHTEMEPFALPTPLVQRRMPTLHPPKQFEKDQPYTRQELDQLIDTLTSVLSLKEEDHAQSSLHAENVD